MTSPRGSRPRERERAVATSERAYRLLLRAYPRELRDEYGDEMVRCFRDLCREELEGGGLGLAGLWARTLPELLSTAIKERSIVLAKSPYRAIAGSAGMLVLGQTGDLHHRPDLDRAPARPRDAGGDADRLVEIRGVD